MAQAENLKAAAVGEDWACPIHKAVQAAQGLHHVATGAQREMIRVGEDNLGVTGNQLVRGYAFDRGIGSNRHEHRSLDPAVRRSQQTGTRRGLVACLNRELESMLA